MKVKTEKLPKSRLALDIELEQSHVEKGLDRAARRLSEKHQIPGFRKGKVPRFIIERYFGREQLMEEASSDLINRAFKEALKQENIVPIGQSSVESINPDEPFRFRIIVPIPPTVTLPDYHTIRIPLDIPPVTDEVVEQQMTAMRERHAVLREPEEPRPAQEGDQLTVKFRHSVDGDWQQPDDDYSETTLIMVENLMLPELYAGLIGVTVDEQRQIPALPPDDHPNEEIRGKEVFFDIQVTALHERLLPEWDELPELEEFDGDRDALRESVQQSLHEAARYTAEQTLVSAFLDQLLDETEYDIPDVVVEQTAQNFLNDQEQEYQRYGVSFDQFLQQQGKTREDVLEDIFPEAEKQVKISLVLQEMIHRENLNISDAEVQFEIQNVLQSYQGDMNELQDPNVAQEFIYNVAQSMINRKLRERMIAIATDTLSLERDTDEPAQLAAPATPEMPDTAAAHERERGMTEDEHAYDDTHDGETATNEAAQAV